jgi:hypothetical protein
MGWNVTDYPSAPRETAPRDVDTWECADCSEAFGELSIVDLLDEHPGLVKAGEAGSIYVCFKCLLGRMKVGVANAETEERKAA